jgi:hypothetical protein
MDTYPITLCTYVIFMVGSLIILDGISVHNSPIIALGYLAYLVALVLAIWNIAIAYSKK